MFKPFKNPYKSILIIRANAVSDFRMEVAHTLLSEAGYDTRIITEVPFYMAGQYDTILCCRPGDTMLELLKVSLMAGRRVIIDLDDDFTSIPSHNPAYKFTGPGHPTYLTELKRMLRNPGVLTTYASPELIKRYRVDGVVIPNYYDDANPLWQEAKPARDTVNIGFSGTSTHREDWKLCHEAVKRVMRERPNVKLVVNVDTFIYEQFGEFPEERRLFIPGVPYNDYPLVYKHIDILLIPLRDTYFNRAKSDIKMVECGATRTAYVASDMPVYREWARGGLLAGENGWYEQINRLVDSAEERKKYADDGYEHARERTGSVVGRKWVDLIEKVANENPVP